jgi:hypothetical protein
LKRNRKTRALYPKEEKASKPLHQRRWSQRSQKVAKVERLVIDLVLALLKLKSAIWNAERDWR